MWTFTLADVCEVKEFGKRWNKLLIYLKRHQPKWNGIRVFEMHPGRWGEFSHGYHVHVVTSKFYDLTWVLSIAKKAGWGRVDWRPLTTREDGEYVAKYLQKKRPATLKGVRLVSTFGIKGATRLKDIECVNTRSRIFKMMAKTILPDGRRWESAGWNERLAIVAAWEWRVVAEDMVWWDDYEMFGHGAPPDFTRLRERLDSLIPDGKPPEGWVPPPDKNWSDEQYRERDHYEMAIRREGAWTAEAKRYRDNLITLYK